MLGQDDGNGTSGASPINFATDISQAAISPLSPEVAGFMQYGNVDINYYTGSPSINVPIHVLQGKYISLPISLNYTGGNGIKVSELASSTGLGWNLQYGGAVSRQVQGLPDQSTGSYSKIAEIRPDLAAVYSSPNFQSYSNTVERNRAYQFLGKYRLNDIDIAGDLFNFNVNGFSGTIAMDYESSPAKAYSLDDPTTSVAYSLGATGQIVSWEITNNQGITYIFAKPEETTTTFSTDANEGIYEYVSSWYLTSIRSWNNVDTFNFYYTDGAYYTRDQNQPASESREYYYDPVNLELREFDIPHHNSTLYNIKQFYLTHIEYNGNTVLIADHLTNRLDLEGRKSLDQLELYDILGQEELKALDFEYSYFSSGESSFQKRLRLDKISFSGNSIDSDNSQHIYEYSFDYEDDIQLPARDSKAIDYWGYYNGSGGSFLSGNDVLFNSHEKVDLENNTIVNSDRAPDFSFAKAGILKKMTYPTGGSTSFSYEQHRAKVPTPNDDQEVTSTSYHHGLTGGNDNPPELIHDLEECENFEDDAHYPGNNTQNIDHFQFRIDELNDYTNIEFQISLDSTSPDPVLSTLAAVVIYKTDLGTGECITIGDGPIMQCDFGIPPLTYCDVLASSNSPDIVYHNTFSTGGGTTSVFLNLEQGDYRILLVNGYEKTSLNIQYSLTTINNNSSALDPNVGGLRIRKQESITNDPLVPPLTKYYYYNEIEFQSSGNDLSDLVQITPSNIPIIYDSSGIAQQALRFSETETNISGGISGYSGNNCAEYVDLVKYKFYSSNLARDSNYDITYSAVTELLFDGENFQGANQFDFYNAFSGDFNGFSGPRSNFRPLNGKLRHRSTYNKDRSLVDRQTNTYDYSIIDMLPENGVTMQLSANSHNSCVSFSTSAEGYATIGISPLGNSCPICPPSSSDFGTFGLYYANKYRFSRYRTYMTSQESTRYLNGEAVTTATDYEYNYHSHYQPIAIQSSTSENNLVQLTEIRYPSDLQEQPFMENLINEHRTATPIEQSYYQTASDGSNKERLFFEKQVYSSFLNSLILPSEVKIQKGDEQDNLPLETRLVYDKYDGIGNPLEIHKPGGSSTSFIWGYDGMYMVARIENTLFSTIEELPQFGVGFEISAGLSVAQENALQAIPDDYALLTTYTHRPSIGMTSQTTPNGYTMYYEYDEFNRLKHVKDADGNIYSKNEYNYRTKLSHSHIRFVSFTRYRTDRIRELRKDHSLSDCHSRWRGNR